MASATEHRPDWVLTEQGTYPHVHRKAETWKTVGPVSVARTDDDGKTIAADAG